VTGILLYNGKQASREHEADIMRQKLQLRPDGPKLFEEEAATDGDKNVGIDSEGVASAVGVNNNFIKRVRFTVGQADYKRTVLSLKDEDDGTRFEVPDTLLRRETAQYQYRLDMANFKKKDAPFSFSFASTRTGEMLVDSAD
jgi:hypothetical protein